MINQGINEYMEESNPCISVVLVRSSSRSRYIVTVTGLGSKNLFVLADTHQHINKVQPTWTRYTTFKETALVVGMSKLTLILNFCLSDIIINYSNNTKVEVMTGDDRASARGSGPDCRRE